MKTPAKPPVKTLAKTLAKPPAKTDKKDSADWLSIGVICLLVCGTLGAKMLLLIDNDLEIKTKFSGKTWQLNAQSIRQYLSHLDRLTAKLAPVGAQLQQQSVQLANRASDALSKRQDFCVDKSQLTKIFKHPQNSAPEKVDRQDKLPKDRQGLSTAASPSESRDWCISIGAKK